jgi:hypothetical protein
MDQSIKMGREMARTLVERRGGGRQHEAIATESEYFG